MSFVTDPRTGHQLLELSHVWGLGAPSYPGQEDVKMVRSVKHAQHGVLAWKTSTSLHTGTYMLAPYPPDPARRGPGRHLPGPLLRQRCGVGCAQGQL